MTIKRINGLDGPFTRRASVPVASAKPYTSYGSTAWCAIYASTSWCGEEGGLVAGGGWAAAWTTAAWVAGWPQKWSFGVSLGWQKQARGLINNVFIVVYCVYCIIKLFSLRAPPPVFSPTQVSPAKKRPSRVKRAWRAGERIRPTRGAMSWAAIHKTCSLPKTTH